MSSLCQLLADQGVVLLAAATWLLAVGCVGVALQRSPIHRQRAGELAILGVLAGLILVVLPLPRFRIADWWPAGLTTPDSPPPDERVNSPPLVIEPVAGPAVAEARQEEGRPVAADLLPPDPGAAAESSVAVVMLPEPREPPTPAELEPLPTTGTLSPMPDQDHQPASGTSVTPVARQAAPAFDVRSWLSSAYLAGGLACLVWLALGRVLLARMVWSARTSEPWLREVYQRVSFGRRRPRLLVSDRCTRALSFGIWRPTIVLPAEVCRADSAYSPVPDSDGAAWGGRGRAAPEGASCEAWPRWRARTQDSGGLGADFVRPQPPVVCREGHTEALRYVLLHELAHARQRDGWGHLLFNVAFPLLYFHPLYWWVRSRTYLAAELIADDWAAGREAKESYVEALIGLAKGGGRRQLACVGSVRIFGSRSQFYRRMQMLLDRETRLARRCSPRWRLIYSAACLLAVLLVAGTLGVRPAEAQSDEPATPATPAATEPAPPSELPTRPASASEPAAEDKTEAVAEPPEPSTAAGKVRLSSSNPEVLQLQIDVMKRNRDELARLLASAQATIADLTKELDVLKAERAASGRNVYAPRVARTAPSASVPVFPPIAGPSATPGVPPAQPTPPGVALPSPAVTAPVLALLGASLPPVARPVVPYPVDVNVPAQPLGAGTESRTPEGTRLDLVNLATSYADASGELEITRLEYESRKKLANQNAVSTQELAVAEIKAKTAERKVALLRNIAEAALMETKADMDAAKGHLESVSKGQPADRSAVRAAEAQVIRAESRLRILESILVSGRQ